METSDIRELMAMSHRIALKKGWWESDRNFGEQIALMHSELSEALEEWRAGHFINEMRLEENKPEGVGVEFADVLIRIFDTCQAYGIDLVQCINAKMEYNENRPYRHGGKKA